GACAANPALALTTEPAIETLAPTVVEGDNAEDRPNGPINLERIDGTGSRLGLRIKDTPASVTVISRQQIEARG
ncbi:hypothetical protein VUS79_33290, partial [Pseudomonas aeruginosa]